MLATITQYDLIAVLVVVALFALAVWIFRALLR